ncbi:MAG: FAD-dependent oxidoreductase [Thermoleophilaceae bacterium]
MAAGLTAALTDSEQSVFWLDSPEAPEPRPPLEGDLRCELAVIGGGFTGLWAALLAVPDEDVVLLEGDRCGWAASGRNGGFLDASLTHGLENGLARWPDEIDRLLELGRENFDAIRETLSSRGIDAAWEENGFIDVATRAHEVEVLAESAEIARRHGEDVALLDREAVRTEVDSPTYLAALLTRGGGALVDPARLAWGLRGAALEDGVRIFEGTTVTRMRRDGEGVLLETPAGRLHAARVVLATNAFRPLARSIARYVIPVYDYVLMTEPLNAEQRAAIGWQGRQGLGDSGNRFHYYRLSADDRILWGGYEAVYHWANGMRPELEDSAAVFNLLAHNFSETFPQLEGLRFTHRWAGAIDTCSRFCVTFGKALGGRVAYAVGYTGLGLGATRFGARVALDLVHGRDSELTRLELVRSRPLPFPPEPLRYAVVQATRRALIRADERRGKRGLWLRALDRAGAGFDS